MSLSEPALLRSEEGERIRIFGDTEFTLKISSRQSEGAFSLLECVNPAGTYLPPHVHTREDETFYILEGDFEFRVGDRVLRAGPGATVYGPRRIPHAYRVSDSGAGRLVLVTTPGGFEDCMRELSTLPSGPPDMEAIFEVCARYGIEFLPLPTG